MAAKSIAKRQYAAPAVSPAKTDIVLVTCTDERDYVSPVRFRPHQRRTGHQSRG
jgi:hypothetical protein